VSLTGWPLLFLLAVAAIASPFAGVRLWSVWKGRGRTAFRVGLFLVAQLSAVALAVTVANDYAQFYPSWSDLLRAAHPGREQVSVEVKSFGAAEQPVAGESSDSTSSSASTLGRAMSALSVASTRGGAPTSLAPHVSTRSHRPPHGPAASPGGQDRPLVGPLPPSAEPRPVVPPEAIGPQVASGSQLGLDTGPGDLTAADAHAIAAGLRPWSPPDQWAQQGTMVRLPVPGDAGRAPEFVLAFLPPSYFGGGPGAAHLPMVELLTGYPGTPTSLVGKLHAVDALRADLASGAVSPMVFVMTRPVEPYPRDTECMDIPGGPSNMHFLAKDVPRSAAELLHLSVPRMGVIGYSSGGYCALKLAMTFPGTYVGAGSMSGYYAAEPGPQSGGDLFGHDKRVRDEADLNWRLDHLPAPATAVVLATARDEVGRDGIKPAETFLRRVRAPMAADEIVRSHGGHNFGTWSEEFPDMLHWMNRRLDEVAAAADRSDTTAPGDIAPSPSATPAADRPRPWAGKG
jgi:hypothetical protein